MTAPRIPAPQGGEDVKKVPIKRALVSVYDKTGLAELAGAVLS